MAFTPPRASGAVPIVTEKDAAVVLPPPSASNPVPTLPSALRLDNREQLMSLLETDPTGGGSMASKRQLLVFSSDSLRTLLMRQVLSDPSTRTYKGKKNWDTQNVFPLPRGLGIVGTRILQGVSSSSPRVRTATETSHDAAEVSLLADSTSIDSMEDGGVLPDNINIVTYFIRPTPLGQTQSVAARIRAWKSNRTHHRIVYLPQPTALCHKVLTNLGLAVSRNNVSIHRLQLDVFPLESDVLSLELDDAVRETDVEGTPSTLITTAARSLLKVQDVVGRIPRIQAIGPLGEEIVRKTLSLTLDEHIDSQEENAHVVNEGTPEAAEGGGDVAALVVMDRKVDMVTPMLTPLTFEGLLDDVIGIDCGFIKVDVNIINPPDHGAEAAEKQNEREIVALPAHGSDTLYAEVRDQHVEKFGQFLQNQAKALKESHAEFTNKGKKKDLNEIHQFVKQIPVFTQNLRSLTNHIHLAELVKQKTESTTFRERWQTERSMVEGELCYDMLEDLIASQYPPYRLLQLLCLQSLCGGGIKSSKYDQLRRDVVQTYGYEFLFVLHNLEKAGLLRRRETIWMDSASPFNSLRKSLILINAEVDPVDPDDVSYVSSGYAPLTTRLLQTAIQGWGGKDEVLRELPGRLVDITQQYPPEDLTTAMKRSPGPSLGSIVTADETSKKPTMIVFFVGGVTFMEIAALRFLSRRQSFPYHIICLTTKVINGKSLLHSLS